MTQVLEDLGDSDVIVSMYVSSQNITRRWGLLPRDYNAVQLAIISEHTSILSQPPGSPYSSLQSIASKFRNVSVHEASSSTHNTTTPTSYSF
jgi:hypothetical protein